MYLSHSIIILSIKWTNYSHSNGLSYESKQLKFYPLAEPLKIIFFSKKVIIDNVSLVLSTSIKSSHNKKSKVSFRNDITLNKTIFSDSKQTIHKKNIMMIPLEPIKDKKEMKEKKR